MVWGILGNSATFVVELEVFETKLHSALVGCCICMFTRVHAEEECNMDEIGLVFFKGLESAAAAAWMTSPSEGVPFHVWIGGLGRSSARADE